MLELFRETVICDIDGCLIKHEGVGIDESSNTLLPGVSEQFQFWKSRNTCIVLITAREENIRDETVQQLKSHGLFWHHLIMGVGNGRRVLINDLKPFTYEQTAVAINLERNEGFKELVK